MRCTSCRQIEESLFGGHYRHKSQITESRTQEQSVVSTGFEWKHGALCDAIPMTGVAEVIKTRAEL
jgi:hypothetical protein